MLTSILCLYVFTTGHTVAPLPLGLILGIDFLIIVSRWFRYE